MFVTKTCDLNIQTEMMLILNMMKNAVPCSQALWNVDIESCIVLLIWFIVVSGKVAPVPRNYRSIPYWQVLNWNY